MGVDGPDAAGTTPFADDLAAELRTLGHEAFRASIDDFRQPRAQRESHGSDPAMALYEDGYDYSVFRRVLLDPFRLAGSTGFSTAFFDAERDVVVRAEVADRARGCRPRRRRTVPAAARAARDLELHRAPRFGDPGCRRHGIRRRGCGSGPVPQLRSGRW